MPLARCNPANAHAKSTLFAIISAAAVLLLAIWHQNGALLNLDVAWFLAAAQRMLDGGNYLDDFFEVNMPLAIVMCVPALWLSNITGIEVQNAASVWTYALIAQCLCLIWHTFPKRLSLADNAPNIILVAWLALMLSLFPAYDFSEREHLTIVLALPFVFMLSSDTPLSPTFRAYIAFCASIGSMIKPHYALLPALLLLPRALETGWRRILVSPEAITYLATALLYAFVVVLLFPEWFTVARWAADLYGYYSKPYNLFLTDSGAVSMIASLMLFTFFITADQSARRRLLPFVIAMAYSWMAFLVQGKGWHYQLLPAAMIPASALPLLISRDTFAQAKANLPRKALCATTMLSIGFHSFALPTEMPVGIPRAVFEDIPKHSSLLYLSVYQTPSLWIYSDTKLTSRYSALWPLWSIATLESSADIDKRALARMYKQPFLHSVVDDLRRRPPDRVIVELNILQNGIPASFELSYLMQSPSFAREWSAYGKIGTYSKWDVYARRPPP